METNTRLLSVRVSILPYLNSTICEL